LTEGDLMDVSKAAVVKSLCGRDSERLFAVVDIVDKNYVLIADGMLRKVQKPKRKKIKHLNVVGMLNDNISGRISEGLHVTNHEIRKALNIFREEEN
jgi:ribosomal protein L14E/L6E/L27E